MGKRLRWCLYSFLTGSFLCLNDHFQPFHLKSLQVENFSAEFETKLRDWSESFLNFHPAWLLAKSELKSYERQYPFTIETQWNPFRGALKLTAVPFVPAMKIVWQHAEYLIAQDGAAWRRDLWDKVLTAEIPQLPELRVGNSFPLLEDLGLNGITHLTVPYQWLDSLQQTLLSQKDLKASDVELLRRGGEDVVACVFENMRTKSQSSFIGKVSHLEKSLIVVRELTGAKPEQKTSIDATYEDKIIIKKNSVIPE
ncbi:MAG: hypothetical protein SOY64_01120 [Pyramidobacter sp.]|uniref:hypothetical protein n=1 Tax=Pyramidobacter sp. TaxID=1943581 RepID=UPI002A814EC8|nr:hypothetical protein [Pyramidobacter sp.]MDY4031654.1 hypothetical protein [Pyramidobacter sp.]